MNKIAIIGDTHFDIYGPDFLNNQLQFFSETLIPYCKENEIKILFFEGDIFQNRKNVSTLSNNLVLKLFKETLSEFTCYIILGNHDTFFKTTNDTNSLKYLGLLENVNLIEKNTEIKLFNRDVLFIPWIYDIKDFENYIQEINPKKYDLVLGHFDIIKARMTKQKISEVGIDKKTIFSFRLIFSGHYHSMSMEKQGESELVYTGTPYQLDRSDKQEDKGFFVIDFDTMKYEMIKNDKSVKFEQLIYPEEFSENKIKNNIIDVYVSNNETNEDIQEYLKKINEFNPFQPPLVKFLDESSIIENSSIEVKSLEEMFKEYIETINIETELKPRVEEEINSLYELCRKEEIK